MNCIISMRYFVLIVTSIIMQCTYSQKEVNKTEPYCHISGTVWLSEQYCGGTEPTSYPPDLSYGNLTFYLFKGGINDTNKTLYTSFTTDGTGHYSFDAPIGIYSIQLDQNISRTIGYCMDDLFWGNTIWSQGPCYQLNLQKSISNLNFGFYHPCPDGPDRM